MNNKPIDPAKLPKTLRPLARKITDFEDDRINQNGYWVHLACGWFSDEMETHIIHEDTLAVCASMVRSARPCKCEECEADISKLTAYTLTFVESGDFFTTVSASAEKAGRALGVTIQQFNGKAGFGIPRHCLDSWSKQLNEEGYEVVIETKR